VKLRRALRFNANAPKRLAPHPIGPQFAIHDKARKQANNLKNRQVLHQNQIQHSVIDLRLGS
jgi:hypothetical protein